MFLSEPPVNDERRKLFEDDIADDGYVMNLTRGWAWMPQAQRGLFELMAVAAATGGLEFRDRAIVVSAAASTLTDAYCSLAWGTRLARATDPATAGAVLRGETPGTMTERESALAHWSRLMASDPNSTTSIDVDRLRSAGLTDEQIFAVTLYVALRIAFSTVNDAIGAHPDIQLVEAAPGAVAEAVSFGRAPHSTDRD